MAGIGLKCMASGGPGGASLWEKGQEKGEYSSYAYSDPDYLLASIRTLQKEVEAIYRQAFDEWQRRRLGLSGEFQRQQRRYKIRPLRLSPAPGTFDRRG